MYNQKKIIILIALLAVLIITSCDWEVTGDYKSFSFDLRGTWVSNDTSVYSGILVIDFDSITITGFNEGQTPSGTDDNRRPFRDFTKGTALKGYSEEGKFFLEDRGLPQEGIPYTLYTAGNYPQETFILFTFGNRAEIMKKQK